MGTLTNEQTMTQCDMILRYMQDFGSISQVEAAAEFGCYRLSGRIYDLKQRGIPIDTTMESRKNRYGKKISFARYTLTEQEGVTA